MQFLLLVLEAPLLSFGRESVDARGPITDFPGASMLTGLLANALGWRREQRERHVRLQERLRYGARLDRAASRFTEFQTAQRGAQDRGWTTRGAPEGRAGAAATYESPHIRRREFDADASVAVALRLDPAGEAPDLPTLAEALARPARPLFLGRKSCLPSRPILAGLVDADGLIAALAANPPPEEADSHPRYLLPPDEAGAPRETILVADLRNWRSGMHGGQRPVRVGRLPTAAPERLPG